MVAATCLASDQTLNDSFVRLLRATTTVTGQAAHSASITGWIARSNRNGHQRCSSRSGPSIQMSTDRAPTPQMHTKTVPSRPTFAVLPNELEE